MNGQAIQAVGQGAIGAITVADFDPEGQDIGHAFARSLRDEFGVENIELVKVAFTAQQAEELNLPPMMKAKKGSSRREKFVDEHGETVFELEALEPATLQDLLRSAINDAMDLESFNKEIDAEKQDAASLAETRLKVHGFLNNLATK